MSDPTTEQESTTPAAEAADPAPETPEATPEGTESPNAEAAKYRRRLRDTESERDALAARIESGEQHLVDYALSAAGLDARLWQVSEVDLEDFRSEAGHLDIAGLIERAGEIRRELSGGPQPNPQQGNPSHPPKGGLADVFRQ